MLRAACSILLMYTLACATPAAGAELAGSYSNAILDGGYSAHDLFAIFDGSGETSTGLRNFDSPQVVSFVTFASETPLNYEVKPEGAFRIFKTGGFDSGLTGTAGLQGDLAVWERRAAAGADGQVPKGYAALRLSLARGTGLDNGDFKGNYVYAAVLFTPSDAWRAINGTASANGTGNFTLTRSDGSASGPYTVSGNGETTLGTGGRGTATLDVSGDLLLQSVDIAAGRDTMFPSGAMGLAFYLRKMQNATAASLRGTYRVHRLIVKPGAASEIAVGSVTAGGAGRFFGSVNGAAFNGQATVAADGAFSVAGDTAMSGALGAGGDLALRWTSNGQVQNGSGALELQLWVRTAGGGALPGDNDGDGLSNTEENMAGTSPNDADSDDDGLLDNADAQPLEADNVFTAQLNPATINLQPDSLTTPPVSLTLMSNAFPFFDWSLSANAPWLGFAKTGGNGDGPIALTLNTASFTPAGSPYTADITVTAPAMKSIAPLRLTVNVGTGVIVLNVTPSPLSFEAAADGLPPTPQQISIASSATNFIWTTRSNQNWLSISPDHGSGAGNATISINPAGLPASTFAYNAQIDFFTTSASQSAATLPVSLTVLPSRPLNTPFPVARAEQLQTSPALAYAPGVERYAIAWTEGAAAYGALLDTRGGPRYGRTRLSLGAAGAASQPCAVIDPVRRVAWYLWRVDPGDGLGGLQARTLTLDTGEFSAPFGFAAGPGDLNAARVVYIPPTGTFAVAYVLQGDLLTPQVHMLRYNPAAQAGMGEVTVSTGDRAAVEPDIAVADARGEIMVAWSVQPGDGTSRVHYRRFTASGGAALGAEAALPPDGQAQRLPRVHFDAAEQAWRIVWLQSGTTANTAGTLFVSRIDAVSGALLNTNPLSSGAVRAPLHAAAYSVDGEQSLALWGDSATGHLTGQRVAGGGFLLGAAAPLTPGNAAQNLPALAYNSTDNEYFAVWQDAGILPAAIYGMRLAGGLRDNDADGLPNGWELEHNLDPFDAAGTNGAAGDPDADSATNAQELVMGSDPRRADTDGDGLTDLQEDPNRNGVVNIGESSALSADTDGDGANDGAELAMGTDPQNLQSIPDTAIYRIDYGRFQAGAASEVFVRAYISAPGTYELTLNASGSATWLPPTGWSVVQPGLPLQLARGVHDFSVIVTAPSPITTLTAWGAFRFDLRRNGTTFEGPAVQIIVDPRATGVGAGSTETPDAIAARFAPVFKAHHDEFYPPIPVESFLEAATLRPQPGRALRRAPGALDLAQLSQVDAELDLASDTVAGLRARFETLPPRDAVAYYTIAPLGSVSAIANVPADAIAIQYYVLFFADEWGLAHDHAHRHEGDWEMAQVLLDKDLKPLRLTLTQQWQLARGVPAPGGETTPWAQVETVNDTHPVVYLGGGGHSLYARSGANRHAGALEDHDGLGTWYVPAGAQAGVLDYPVAKPLLLTPLGRLGEAASPPWLRYAGRWGQRGFPPGTGDAPTPGTQDGTLGPLFMGTTSDPETSSGVRSLWIDPYAWSARALQTLPVELVTVGGEAPRAFAGQTLALLDARGRIYRAPIDAFDSKFSIQVPPGDYSLVIVQPGALGSETFVAPARFPTDTQVVNLFSVPAAADFNLGLMSFDAGFLESPTAYATSDADGDGIPDRDDADQDDDGVLNAGDTDALGDGFIDAYQVQDPDRDGIPNVYDDDDDGDDFPDADDLDADGDNVPDADEANDTDGDGVADAADLDMDNDGFDNAAERAAGTNPLLFFDHPGQRVGDLNADDSLNAVDIQLLVNIALRRAAFTPLADFDRNGQCSAADVQALLNLVLGK